MLIERIIKRFVELGVIGFGIKDALHFKPSALLVFLIGSDCQLILKRIFARLCSDIVDCLSFALAGDFAQTSYVTFKWRYCLRESLIRFD